MSFISTLNGQSIMLAYTPNLKPEYEERKPYNIINANKIQRKCVLLSYCQNKSMLLMHLKHYLKNFQGVLKLKRYLSKYFELITVSCWQSLCKYLKNTFLHSLSLYLGKYNIAMHSQISTTVRCSQLQHIRIVIMNSNE